MQHTRPNMSKSGLTISERRKSSSKMLNGQKSMPTVSHKINSSNRFVGGADKESIEENSAKASPESIQEVPNPSPSLSPPNPSTLPSSPVEKSLEKSMQLEENSQDKQLLPASGPCCFCIPQTPGSVGDRKVDEIIEYVHQNLEEAGKALATLGENFEHDLKLIFVDFLGRIKQWSGIVQNKLDACKNEVDNLRKELLARACEIDVKTRELKDLKAQIADYQSRLLPDNELPKKDLKRNKLERKEQREAQLVAENAQTAIAKEIVRNKTNATKNAARIVDEKAEEDVTAAIAREIKKSEKINARENVTRAANQVEENEKDEEGAQAVDRIEEEEEEEEGDEEDEERAVDKIIERVDEDEEESLRKKKSLRRKDDKKKVEDVAYTNATVQVQEKERMKREFELESEIKWLRKEYDRVMKERAEYESAIQRALLRGVSSLNVEALRVLRCPPIPCCTPCVPCPATARIIPPEPIVPCPSKSRRRRPESAAAVSSAKVSHDRNTRNDDQTDCITKRPSTGPCCSVNRSRKSKDDGMVFLLHQGDAGNLGAPDEVCGSTIMKKIEIPPLPRFGI